MPDTIAAPPASSATVRQVSIVDSGPPKAPPAPTREIKASDIANLPGEVRGKSGAEESSRSSMRKNLEGRSKPIGDPTTVPTQFKETPKEEKSKPAVEEPAEEPGGEPAAETPPKADAQIDPKTGKPKKANPWKLFDEEKKKRGEVEAELQRVRTSVVPDQERTAIMERVTKAEARAKELEDEIRFHAYEKSTEFKDQYQAPYEAAWKRATNELSEISILDPNTNQQRGVTSQDILELVNLPLGKAREVADAVFGKFSDDVMAHRKEIRGLFEKQNQALDEAKKNGGVRDQQRREQYQKQHAETQGFVSKTWKESNDEFLADPVNGEYFKPKTIAEGQQPTPEESEWNDALARGFKLVDEAWGSNAMAPGLTTDQRKAIIKKNAAVRNRAAAFGPLKRHAKRLEAKIARLEKDLSQYSESTPAASGRTPNEAPRSTGSAKQGFFDAVRKKAH